ncbi:hypothetical protein E2C01_048839 [Portunus trituberculatus]|uniref:Protein kinase domain-containing protein n=1 Tax=Portunus trituberculatus TaxID=210409 RepID=A0A5B7G447_PORTR|nr:hypothetical protein [Portunus trituberculatus]
MRSHVPFLTREELHSLDCGRLLGEGGFGRLRLMTWENGAPAVVKELLQAKQLLPVLAEATTLLQLSGAGGAPQLLECLVSLEAVCHCLQEVHGKGILHNDLKWNNITFTGTVSAPNFHIIDFGPASSSTSYDAGKAQAQNLVEVTSKDDDDSLYSRKPHWVAPEVYTGKSVFPSGDVYSLGWLIDDIMDWCTHDFLTGPLRSLSSACTARDASRLPSLAQVSHCLAILAKSLTLQQLTQKFYSDDGKQDEGEGKEEKVNSVLSEKQDDDIVKVNAKKIKKHKHVIQSEWEEDDQKTDDIVSEKDFQEEKNNERYKFMTGDAEKNGDHHEEEDVDSQEENESKAYNREDEKEGDYEDEKNRGKRQKQEW